MHGMQVDN